jgi:hypothetical protein
VVHEGQRPVLREEADEFQAGVHDVGEREIDDAEPAAEGHGGLGTLRRENVQSAADAARQQHHQGVARRPHALTTLPDGISA